MGRSVGNPADEPDGRVEMPKARAEALIRHQGSQLTLELNSQGVRASWPVAWSVGAGLVGRTDLVRVGDYLFQSPVSWYSKTNGWDLSPGYENRSTLDVDRPIVSGCLFCHTGAVQLGSGTENQFAPESLTAISCERCHGPAATHLANPVSGSIVNPAKLAGATRDSVCEQCHLEGEVRILNPGRDWWDFHPGSKTEEIFVTYVKTSTNGRHLHAVSHSEQLAESRCLRASGGKLWCGSCHDPHAGPAGESQRIADVCRSCHQQLSASREHDADKDCVHCHMPRLRADNVAHTAITDHTIPRIAQRLLRDGRDESFGVRPWRGPRPELETRDDGLALIDIGQQDRNTAQIREGYGLLV
jgi:predicted CXXCH cytochrome family protein